MVEGVLPESEAEKKMASGHHTSKSFDGPGRMLNDYDTQLAMAISASLNEGWHYVFGYQYIFDMVMLPLNQRKVLEGSLVILVIFNFI